MGKRKKAIVNRSTALAIASARNPLAKLAEILPSLPKETHWYKYGKRLVEAFSDGPAVVSDVFKDGNTKMSYKVFSALPIVTCPGRGSCVEWCYSLGSWRYPAAFYRQIQNTVLLRTAAGRALIAKAFHEIPAGMTVRLYVDGDFDSMRTLRFWMTLVATRPDLSVYGYTKSLDLLLKYEAAGLPWPRNYLTNLSTGSKYDGTKTFEAARQLQVTRGLFLAVDVHAVAKDDKEARRMARAAILAATREAAGQQKAFACPGICDKCLPDGTQACGSERFREVAIGEAMHGLGQKPQRVNA